jgi:hypothetical protein
VDIRHGLQKGDDLLRSLRREIAVNTRLQTRADVEICHWRPRTDRPGLVAI